MKKSWIHCLENEEVSFDQLYMLDRVLKKQDYEKSQNNSALEA